MEHFTTSQSTRQLWVHNWPNKERTQKASQTRSAIDVPNTFGRKLDETALTDRSRRSLIESTCRYQTDTLTSPRDSIRSSNLEYPESDATSDDEVQFEIWMLRGTANEVHYMGGAGDSTIINSGVLVPDANTELLYDVTSRPRSRKGIATSQPLERRQRNSNSPDWYTDGLPYHTDDVCRTDIFIQLSDHARCQTSAWWYPTSGAVSLSGFSSSRRLVMEYWLFSCGICSCPHPHRPRSSLGSKRELHSSTQPLKVHGVGAPAANGGKYLDIKIQRSGLSSPSSFSASLWQSSYPCSEDARAFVSGKADRSSLRPETKCLKSKSRRPATALPTIHENDIDKSSPSWALAEVLLSVFIASGVLPAANESKPVSTDHPLVGRTGQDLKQMFAQLEAMHPELMDCPLSQVMEFVANKATAESPNLSPDACSPILSSGSVTPDQQRGQAGRASNDSKGKGRRAPSENTSNTTESRKRRKIIADGSGTSEGSGYPEDPDDSNDLGGHKGKLSPDFFACPYHKYDPSTYRPDPATKNLFKGCGYPYANLDALKQHLVRVHLPCERCSQTFASRREALNHYHKLDFTNAEGPPSGPCQLLPSPLYKTMTFDMDTQIRALTPTHDKAQWESMSEILLAEVADATDDKNAFFRSAPEMTLRGLMKFVAESKYPNAEVMMDVPGGSLKARVCGQIYILHVCQAFLDYQANIANRPGSRRGTVASNHSLPPPMVDIVYVPSEASCETTNASQPLSAPISFPALLSSATSLPEQEYAAKPESAGAIEELEDSPASEEYIV